MSTSSSSNPSSARAARTTSSARAQREQSAAWRTRTRATGTGPSSSSPRHALHREPVRRHAQARLHRLSRLPGLLERARDDVVELRVDLLLAPEVLLEALHPLEVRDDDAACVREDVREDEHAAILEDRVRCGRHGAVRALADEAALTRSAFSSVITCSSAHGARMSHWSSTQLLVRHRLCVREPGERPVLLLVRERHGTSMPFGLWTPPCESDAATTLEPSRWRRRARFAPTFPNPWIATV